MSNAAASLPIDLSGAIFDHLQRLDESGRAVIRWANASFVAPTAGSFQLAALHIRLALVSNRAVRTVSKLTSDSLENLIWLRGLKATVESGDDKLAENVGALLPRIEALQGTFESLRNSVISLRDCVTGSTTSPALRSQRFAAFQKYLAVEADVYAALEEVRWAILEREADADIEAGRIGQTFTSAADLMASLSG